MHINTNEYKQLFLLGAGGHAKVVIDALACQQHNYQKICLYDDNHDLQNTQCLNLTVNTPLPELSSLSAVAVHIAIGNNAIRQQLAAKLAATDLCYARVIHKQAVIAESANLAAGCFAAAQSLTGPEASIATGTIINHAAVVDHECQIGGFCHIAPNATLGGNVIIGNNVFIGAGATVLPGINICDHVTIGAGAVVTKNITKPGTYIGIPAR